MSILSNQILTLSEKEIQTLLSPADAIQAVEDVFIGLSKNEIILGNASFLETGIHVSNRFLAMPSSLPTREISGLKWISTYHSPEKDLPFSHGNLMIINDSRTAKPLAIIGADSITVMRTAGGHSVVCSKYLCTANPTKMAIIGSGNQARSAIKGFQFQFPSLKEIRIWSNSLGQCYDIQEMFRDSIQVTVCNDAASAIADSPLTIVVTSSTDVLVTSDMIRPGMTIIGISAFLDLDPSLTSKADKWVIGGGEDNVCFFEDTLMTHGVKLSESQAYATLPEIINHSKPGRESDEEIIVFSHMGMGAFDISCANIAYRKALRQGIGTWITI